ncbi:MAG: hypothetical protein HFI11_00305 [Lachnospiraceae bacterium]|jgi:chromosome segregation ATPase|nr:hypothetical protein [Lachnospiraceae bacterium]
MILTNEDLLAISQIVDKRLEIRLKPIEKDISALDDKVNALDVKVNALDDKVNALDDKVNALDDKVNALDDKVNALDNKFIDLNHRVESLESGLHNVRLFQENIILPRLNTIESCYLDTFNRYQKNADKMEIVYEDVDLLKKVAADHSEKLQKLA